MTVDYASIEISMLELLKSSPQLNMVKTFERTVRECLFTGEKITSGFRPEELPAINITCELEPTNSTPFTTGEIRYQIPLTVIVIVKHQQKVEARRQLLELMAIIEKIVNRARKTDGLGLNTLVMGDVVSSVVIAEDHPHHFGVGNITASVTQVVEL